MSTQQATIPAVQPTVARRRPALRRDGLFALLLVLPTLLIVLGVSVYPVGYAIRTSLRNINPSFGMDMYVGLENYRLVLQDPEFRSAIKVTARFAISTTVLSMLLGLGMALVLNERFKGRGLLRSVILLPWVMSVMVVDVLWAWIYDCGFGTLNDALYKLGIIEEYQAWLSS